MFETSRKASVACSPECQRENVKKYTKIRQQEKLASRPKTKLQPCGWCGEDIEVDISYRGNRLYHDECRAQGYKATNLRKNNKRRDVPVKRDVSLEAVVQRDGLDCHICGELVDLDIPRNSRMGATIDHVLPVSKGGDSSLENLRLAHWICNIRKSDSLEFVDG